jgi:DNA-directed RNA polymerase specialized sigma24 family protein
VRCEDLQVELLGRYSNQAKWTLTVEQASRSLGTTTEETTLRRTVRQLSPDHVTKLIADYEAGATVYELAEKYKINRKTVSEQLHRHGVSVRRQGLAEEVQAAAVLYIQGLSLVRIADRFGVNHGTVWRALKASGVPMRDTHGHNHVRRTP